MRAFGDDLAVIKDDDPVGTFDCCQAVRHDQRGAAFGQCLDRRLHGTFAFSVQGTRRLVQQQNLGVAQNGAGDGDALLLPTRQHHPAFAQPSVIAFGLRGQKVMRGGSAGGGLNLGIRRVGAAKADVFAGRCSKDHRVLRHHRKGAAEIAPRHVAQIDPVQTHRALFGIVKPHQQLQDRCLARAGRADKRHGFPRPHDQADAFQRRNLGSGGIAEGHGIEHDLAAHRTGQRRWAGRIAHRVIGLQQFDQPFGGPCRPLQFAPDFRKRANRSCDHHRIDQELHQFARRHRPCPHIPRADPQHPDNTGEDQEDDDYRHHRPRADPFARRIERLFGDIGKGRAGAPFVGEGLHRLDRR